MPSCYLELQVTSESRMGRRSWVPEEAVSLTSTEGFKLVRGFAGIC